MSHDFKHPGHGNSYDRMEVDIVVCHQEINQPSTPCSRVRFVRNPLRALFDKVLFALGLYRRLIDSGWYRAWFLEFQDYWTNCLGGRPLYLHDFFFLYSWYRTRFQDVEIKEQGNMDSFVEAWRDPRNIYAIFGAVYKYSLSPFQYYRFKKYLKPQTKILEYGCGIAPIVSGMINDGRLKHSYTIADIPQFPYHYAKWRLKQFGVACIDINPRVLPVLSGPYDVIFIMQTLEHLPNPLAVVQHLTNYLESGGYLIFDFIISDGDGLDTHQALVEREPVLRFIEKNYHLVKGEVKYNENMGNTVVQKK